MEFIPETVEALDELDMSPDDDDLGAGLKRVADRARRIAPELVGVSIASGARGVTFTLVATDEDIASLDAVQYLTSGPCVEALDDGQGIATTSEGLFSEPRWRALARASAAAGVSSTLTLPVMEDEQVVATVNLYGGTEDAFDGRHGVLAEVFNAWAPGAVTNADLEFSTRRQAERAPEDLRDDAAIEAATGVLAASYDLPVERAQEQLRTAAARAGVPVATLARVVVELLERED